MNKRKNQLRFKLLIWVIINSKNVKAILIVYKALSKINKEHNSLNSKIRKKRYFHLNLHKFTQTKNNHKNKLSKINQNSKYNNWIKLLKNNPKRKIFNNNKLRKIQILMSSNNKSKI